MMNTNITFISLLWAICAAGVTWNCFVLSRQITYVTLADGRQQQRNLPLILRLLLPLCPKLASLFQKSTFDKLRLKFNSQIEIAGFKGLISSEELFALQIILPVVLGIPWLFFVHSALSLSSFVWLSKLKMFLYFFGFVWFFFYPVIWLRTILIKRQRKIQRALPFKLDILTLSVEAGMDFMSALQRSVERARIDPLEEEIIRLVHEIQLGKTRTQALKDMSARINLTDMRAVVNSLVQANELGVSIGSILRIQSDQIRQRRFERAERLANEAPVKMLFPLLFFIFPSIFLILLAPIVSKMLQQLL
ncbi:type II secretion system F family protein [Verrucomicrobiota bacterium]